MCDCLSLACCCPLAHRLELLIVIRAALAVAHGVKPCRVLRNPTGTFDRCKCLNESCRQALPYGDMQPLGWD